MNHDRILHLHLVMAGAADLLVSEHTRHMSLRPAHAGQVCERLVSAAEGEAAVARQPPD